jgi:hypothetical protein
VQSAAWSWLSRFSEDYTVTLEPQDEAKAALGAVILLNALVGHGDAAWTREEYLEASALVERIRADPDLPDGWRDRYPYAASALRLWDRFRPEDFPH